MNSCFEHSPFCYSHFFFPTPSSSQCSFPSPFLLRNVPTTRRKNRTVIACLRQENPKDRNYCARRGIVFMGFAIIPVSNMRADAIEDLIAENTELRAQDQKQKEKQPVQESSSRNSFFSLVNALGFLGSGVLAALYALTKKGKDSAAATIESMNIELNEKGATITSLEKKFEAELLKEKEVCKEAIAKANKEHRALLSQLKLANDTIISTGHELQKQKRLAEELTFQLKDLEVELCGAGDEKTELQEQLKEKLDALSVLQERINLLASEIKDKDDNCRRLNSKFAEKETELDRLSSVYRQSEDRVIGLNSEIGKLNILVSKNEKELELKNEVVDKLNAELIFSLSEKNESSKKVDDITDEYNQFKSSIEEKLASEVGLLGEKEEKIRLLEEQIKCSSDEVKKNEGLISDLSKEKDDLKGMLDMELENAKKLEQELKITQDALEKSRNEASDLTKELKESRHLCSELGKEVSEAEFSEAKESLQRNILETKQEAEILSGELKSPKELLNKSNEDLQITSQELFDAVRKRDILEKELVDAHEKAESAISDLNEEKKITSSLNKELKILETQISKDREFRRSLESNLDEASESLGEMNRNALMLSGELELANSRISSLEDEKDAVFNVLDEKKRVSQEARENLEDAHSLVMRLGKERESLEKRGNRLEEELASAKGEILRLRRQINSSKSSDNVGNQEKGDGKGEDGVGMRKVSRRRKVKPKQKDGP